MQRQLPMLQEKQAWQESDILYRSSAAFHFGFTGMEGGFLYGFSLFKTFAHRAGVLNYNPPALRVVIIVIRKNHLSAL